MWEQRMLCSLGTQPELQLLLCYSSIFWRSHRQNVSHPLPCPEADHQFADLPWVDPSLMLSCITFGSPPVCNASFSALANQARLEATRWRVHVNFVNEFDIVPRLDKLYVLSLINLYRNRFLLPLPITTDNAINDPGSFEHTSSLESDLTSSWPLPDPVFVHLGGRHSWIAYHPSNLESDTGFADFEILT